MATSAGKTVGNAVMWLLVGLLVFALAAGFGITSFSGGSSTVGSVGRENITVQQYFRALMNAVQAEEAAVGQQLSPVDIQARGIPENVRAQLAGFAALDNETARIGLSVGDATVAEQVRSQRAFQGLDGTFDAEAYEFALQQSGWSVREFEGMMRKEAARTILQSAVGGGVSPPMNYVDVILGHYGERRSFEWVAFDAGNLAEPVAEPDEAAIAAFYDSNPEAFTLPVRKRVTYAWLSPEDLLDEIEPDEARLRELYEERLSTYVQPERRLVERLVFGDAGEAVAAKSAIDAGETTFSQLVTDRGLSLQDVDMGDVTREDLGQAASAIFELDAPGIVGPYSSSLGPALFRMNAILNATEVTFEEAREELTEIYARDAARREIDARITDYDDRLAAGATVEDLAAETEMQLGSLDVWAATEGGIADYARFREAVDALSADDFPQIEVLEDGGIYAMRLDEVLEPTLQPLTEVQEAAAEGAAAAALTEALRAVAEAAQTTAAATGSLSSTGTVETADLVTRDSTAGGAPAALVARAFELEVDTGDIVEAGGAVYLVRVTAIEGPSEEDSRTEILRQGLSAQLSQGLSQDVQVLFTQAMTNSAGITFHDATLNAVHTQVFTGGLGGM